MRTDLDEVNEYASHWSVYDPVYATPVRCLTTSPGLIRTPYVRSRRSWRRPLRPAPWNPRATSNQRSVMCVNMTPTLGMEFVLPLPSARLKADQDE